LSDGETAWIRPAEIASLVRDQTIVSFAWGRPDFDAAAREFMIGLLSTACAKQLQENETWKEWLDQPPTPAILDSMFVPLLPYFDLDGPDTRFLQDNEEITGESVPIGQLLIDSPGANTLKKNLDHFVHRGRVEHMSRATAAMALYTLQTFAPSGGAGHRVGLRGGGPLSTLVFPYPEDGQPLSLWTCLWLNAMPLEERPRFDTGDEAVRIFPWAGPTRTSESGQGTTHGHMAEAHAFWGMPRRIRLQFVPNTDLRPCAMTGVVDDMIVTGFVTKPYGFNYMAFPHPLSPYYKAKPASTEWLPVHPQPERLGYRHWLGLVFGESEGSLKRPAAVVICANDRMVNFSHRRRACRLIAAGFDMDNMKARGFVETEMPIYPLPHRLAGRIRNLAKEMVNAADLAARSLGGELRNALGQGGDGSVIAAVKDIFWEDTETSFYKAIETLAAIPEDQQEDMDMVLMQTRERWLGTLAITALRLFDRTVPLDEIGILRMSEMQKLVKARDGLCRTLNTQVRKTAGLPNKHKETSEA
jgi:CRISPR system Cascade subunit CasA